MEFENHLHILTDMNPSITSVDFVKDIKVSSSIWIKRSNSFPVFKSWAVGYGSFTCSYMDINRLIEYIKNQKEHHQKISFEEITIIFSSFRAEKCLVVIYPGFRPRLFIFGSFRACYTVFFSHDDRSCFYFPETLHNLP